MHALSSDGANTPTSFLISLLAISILLQCVVASPLSSHRRMGRGRRGWAPPVQSLARSREAALLLLLGLVGRLVVAGRGLVLVLLARGGPHRLRLLLVATRGGEGPGEGEGRRERDVARDGEGRQTPLAEVPERGEERHGLRKRYAKEVSMCATEQRVISTMLAHLEAPVDEEEEAREADRVVRDLPLRPYKPGQSDQVGACHGSG